MFRSFRPNLAIGTIINHKCEIENKYVRGSGVGARSRFATRAMQKRAAPKRATNSCC
jgi:hypothetical protein